MAMVCALAPAHVAQAGPENAVVPGWADAWQSTVYSAVFSERDVPITMSDGTVLRADIHRPAGSDGRPTETPLPVVVVMTPYAKQASVPVAGSGAAAGQMGVTSELVRSGYVEVVVDVRGTGASQGLWDVLGPREQDDTVEVIDWASRQSWSDGTVGMTGASYLGIAAVQAAAHRAPALKAILPIVPGSDLFRDIVGTGGAIGAGFMPLWLGMINASKWIPDSAALAQGRGDPRWLADRLADPATLVPELIEVLTAPDLAGLPPETLDLAGYSDFYRARQSDPSRIEVPTFLVGAWHDIFANSQPRIYDAIPLPPGRKQLLMGNGYHVTATDGLGGNGAPPALPALQRAWFDKWLKGIDNGIDRYGPVTIYQQGGGWSATDTFPRADIDYQRRYLTAEPSGTAGHAAFDGSLHADTSAAVTKMTIVPGARTFCSRQAIEGTAGLIPLLGTACELDSRFNEADALTFTTAPVSSPVMLSGPMNLHLNTVLDAPDGFWSVSLNDVAPDGTSTVISTGQLTASLRAVDPARSTQTPDGDYADPYHPLDLSDRDLLIPGQPTTVEIGLQAIEAVIQPGHRLRLDIYAFNFPRALPIGATMAAGALRPQHVQLDPDAPSYLVLPFADTSNK
ncbi:CocE/NonD family hydrolase [Nocardia rhamnosiphila]|uniref:CocE/NonD family hydrolase n=1 Tax=Nocardia rhamnosiphila TaxID=426716 RepID=UPI003F4CE0BF